MIRQRLIGITCAILLLASTAIASPVYANSTITVATLADTIAADGLCSLPEAITNANNNAQTYNDCVIGSGNDTIQFNDLLGTGAITLASTLPTISDPAGLTINGGGDITVSGNNVNRILIVNSSLTINNLTLTNGHCTSCLGGTIYSSGGTVTINGSTVAYGVGGIYVYNGTLNITNSHFSNNSDTYGGAVNSSGPLGTVTISNSSFSDNNSSISGGGSSVYNDGALTIANSSFANDTDGRGSVYSDGTATISNSTFSGNSAGNNSNNVGAVYNQGTMSITNSTFSGNGTNGPGGAGDIYQLGPTSTLQLYNNILANSTGGGDCLIENGTVSGSNNLVEDNTNDCGFTDGVNGNIVGQDPNLGTLSGSPVYFPLNSGSPAIDAGSDGVCSAAPVNNTSENGVTRPQGAHCDMGAFELDNTPPTITSIVRAGTNPTSAASVAFNVSFSEAVSGVDASDFALTATGVSGASISGVSGSGNTYTVTVNTGSGNGTIHLDVPVTATISDLASNPPSGLPFTTGDVYTISRTLAFKSNGANDGWVLESSETSGVGGTLNSSASTFQLGDDASNRQFRAILSFDTSALPDNATIQSAVLKIKGSGAVVGTSPFKALGSLLTDIRRGAFGLAGLQLDDFKAAATAGKVGSFNNTPVTGWYTDTLNLNGRKLINKTGLTQLRLYFQMDDNNDHKADFIRFASGNGLATNRPTLTIIYTLP